MCPAFDAGVVQKMIGYRLFRCFTVFYGVVQHYNQFVKLLMPPSAVPALGPAFSVDEDAIGSNATRNQRDVESGV